MSPDEPSLESSVDPRVGRTRTAVLEATLEELAEHGYGALTVEGVARRAAVGKATIYRHWDGKVALVADAIDLLKGAVSDGDTTDVRTRILHRVQAVAEHFASSRFGACMPAIIEASERDAAVKEFHHRTSEERRASMVALFDEAVRSGELRSGVNTEMLAEALVGAVLLRRLMTPQRYDASEVEVLVATVLDPYWVDHPTDA